MLGSEEGHAVHLSKAELRTRAVSFAHRWADETSERRSSQTFWNEFFQLFGLDRKQIAVFEELAERADTGGKGWIDLLYPGELAIEHKSFGENLDDAMGQLTVYLPSLDAAMHPWLLLVCDFNTFSWKNLNEGTDGEFKLSELADNLGLFAWLANHPRPHDRWENEEEVNLAATRLLADVYDRLLANGYDDHALREWITRILFCLFADDTGVWDRAAFHTYVAAFTRPDGRDLGSAIAFLFEILDIPPERRPDNLGDELSQFTYINGDLFSTRLPIPSCDRAIREALLTACKFNWSKISPSVFGSMFQNVMTPEERRELGAHYTTEANILRTIHPLFLDELERELELATTERALLAFHDKLSELTFLDPACGCGNFLVITYREIRRLETEALRRLQRHQEDGRSGVQRVRGRQVRGQRAYNLELLCRVKVGQFYGIEIEEFPAKIARTALYLIDHLANRMVSEEFGEYFVRFPIPSSPHVIHGNALHLDWSEVLPAEHADFVFGNPPFSGHQYVGASPEMVEDRRLAMSCVRLPAGTAGVGRLDFVAAWYAKAIEYMHAGMAVCAFVSTNSITQGEQARTMGPILVANGTEVTFAHRTFAWTSEARGRAHVHVVIIGVAPKERASSKRTLYSYASLHAEPTVTLCKRINWYLVDGSHVYPGKHTSPLVPSVPVNFTKGSQPTDGGHLIVKERDIAQVRRDPIASKYLRRYYQTTEFMGGQEKWCLWLKDADPSDMRNSHEIKSRLEAVRQARMASPTASVRHAADTPFLFTQDRQPAMRYLAVPEVSSANREFIPAAYMTPDQIAGNKLLTMPAAPLWIFALVQSSMWMSWVRAINGRMKSDYSLAVDIAFNACPFPAEAVRRQSQLSEAAERVLLARGDRGLGDLYDPLTMPRELREAHRSLDRVVDACYGRHRHIGDTSRLALLLQLYERLSEGAQQPLSVL